MANQIKRPERATKREALGPDVGSTAPREVNNTVVEQLMTATFGRARPPRSTEYTEGCRALLELKVNRVPLKCPYRMGTVQADAWFAGTDEGHLIWSDFQRRDGAPEMGHTPGSDSQVKHK